MESKNSNVQGNAPWFSSLVRDVASVLGKEDSPFKRKLSVNDNSPSKKRKVSAENEFVDDYDDEEDSFYGLEDKDYYDDQFDELGDEGNYSNNANSSGLLNSQKR